MIPWQIERQTPWQCQQGLSKVSTLQRTPAHDLLESSRAENVQGRYLTLSIGTIVGIMAIVLMFRIDIQLVALRVTSFCYWLYAGGTYLGSGAALSGSQP
ncbi:hypothetical protein C5I_0117825 [Pseudomonas syringae pv. syringae FF5]|nr:hypothetical protein C5I_0117825 [Pseudomonas syringae pv. syringae FF5]